MASEAYLLFLNCLVYILAVGHTRRKAISCLLSLMGSVDKTEQDLHLLLTDWETEKCGTACVEPSIQWIKVIQLRSAHALVIVTIAYLGRTVDSCLAVGDKRLHLPGFIQAAWGLDLMPFETCCMEDKASHFDSSSKDFYSLISTTSAILAPPEISLEACWCPIGHHWWWADF